jgi:general secretion pathway protein A
MYQPYWGLADSPFRGNFDARFFHQGPTQEEALARLNFLVEEKRVLALLTGDAGSGKSLMLETFGRALRRTVCQKASINLVGLETREFLWLIAMRLGVEIQTDSSLPRLFQAICDHLLANQYQQLTTVLLLDDADEASADVKSHIVRLVENALVHGVALCVVLTAQPARLGRLGRRLLELSELRIELDAWEHDDTAAFVKRALAAAGRSAPLFSDMALTRLHELGGGIPRRIKQLADLSLLAGAGDNLAQIEAETIESAFQELGIVTNQTPIAAAMHG